MSATLNAIAICYAMQKDSQQYVFYFLRAVASRSDAKSLSSFISSLIPPDLENEY